MSGLFREVAEEGAEDLPLLNKSFMIGCYAKPTTDGVTAIVRLGVAAPLKQMPELNLSAEHTSAQIMLPNNPAFPSQWSSLGEAAMEVAA